MHKIASLAVGIALFGAAANTHHINLTTVATHPATIKTISTVAKPTATAPSTPQPVMVTVQPGDTLSSIAQAHDTTYVRIFDANDSITNPDVINVDQQVRIPAADEQLPDRALPQTAPAVTAPAAPAAAPAAKAYAAPKASASASASVPVVGNDAKAYIYAHESGNNPNSTSPSGCYGLGQDCNGVVRNQCGADYACQDAYFTNYANSRYGSWEAAAAFWQTHGWW